MSISFESEGKVASNRQLFWQGLVALVITALVVTGLVLKSTGTFDNQVTVTAALQNVGDGLPTKSDVKFRGLLVGSVSGVTPAQNGNPNYVRLSMNPAFVDGIPKTVTARVVPSNAFAVSSVQLVDNGPGAPIDDNTVIVEDKTLPTVQLQTVLTKIRDILRAAGRDDSDRMVGMLATLAAATDRRGGEITRAGGQLDRIVTQLNTVVDPDGGPSTLHELSTAVQGLQQSEPDFLDAIHNAVVPLRTVAEKRVELTNFLSAGQKTFATVGTAMDNNTAKIIHITSDLTPVLGVLGDGGSHFPQMVVRMRRVADIWMSEFWVQDNQAGEGNFVWALTPHRLYTRADCPRYGAMAGPSCQTAPTTSPIPVAPPISDPRSFQPPASLIGGNVGPVGSAQEQQALSRILGIPSTAATDLLLAPQIRGAAVQVMPSATPAGAR